MRDVTRGGLSAVLHEHARAAGSEIRCEKQSLPIQPEAAMAANMPGVDVINLANEGCLCLFVEPDIADDALALLRAHPLGQNAAIVGEVLPTIESKVTMLEPDGTLSTIEELYGAELPRLC